MPLENMEIQQMKNDPLVLYLTKLFDEARFDQILADGSMWCSDSNASLDPHEIALAIRNLLEVPFAP